MIGYLQKFNNLPQDLKDKISSPNIMKVVDELEKQYDVSLATVIMKVMVKDIEIEDLPQFFVFEYKFDNIKASDLVEDLKKRVFFQVGDYLGMEDKIFSPPNDQKEKDQANEWLEKRKDEISSRTSDFFFSPEDEDEIKELTKKFSGPEEGKGIDKNGEKLKNIIKEASLNFSSADLENRFEKILDTYLRGIRIRVDVKHTLMKGVDKGGMGMNDGEAENVLQIASNYKTDEVSQEIKSPPKIRLMEDGPLDISDIPQDISSIAEEAEKELGKNQTLGDDQLRDVGYDFSKLTSQDDKSGDEEKIKVEEKVSENKDIKLLDDGDDMLLEEGKEESSEVKKEIEENIIPEKPEKKIEIVEKKEDKPKIKIQELPKTEEAKPFAQKSSINMADSRRTANQDGKIKMEDVKYVPKLLGPIDELREMNLVNFRRLSQDPDEAAKTIKEKLGFLEEESYKQRVAGVKAWRQSPINRLYLKIGQESIINNKSIETVMSEKQSQGEDYLTNQEFEAIMNLNKDLRF